MIERAIENWLTNTNERNYQLPFCHILMQKGYKIIYVSPHRPMEQGKDIIAIDKHGDCYAYQLKTGNIDLPEWRKIKGEVTELIELPITHPSCNKDKIHASFLVTNGELTDEVRIQIDQINDDNKRKDRGYSYLNIINGKALVNEFIDAQGSFIPKDLKDFSLFLKFYLSDGLDFLSKKDFFDFLILTIFNEIPERKSNAINAINSSVIITSYMLNPYQSKNNYYSLFEAWTLLAGCIIRYANKVGLDKKDWEHSFKLIFLEIIENLSLLKEETLSRKDFLEGDLLGDGGLVYRARTTIVLGSLSALEIYYISKNPEYKPDEKVLNLIKENIKFLWFWGESAFPYFFNIVQYLEINGDIKNASSLFVGLFSATINMNSLRSQIGLANPYYSINDILETLLIDTSKVDLSEFPGGAYTLESMIHFLARRNARKLLETNWQAITHIQQKNFSIDHDEDIFTWRTKDGSNDWKFPNATQSWLELVKAANHLDDVPQLYNEFENLLRFFVIVSPHRGNTKVYNLLDAKA